MLGTIQAAEVLKYLTGAGTLLTDCLLTLDALTMEFRKTTLSRRDDCAVCGSRPSVTTLAITKPETCLMGRGPLSSHG